MARIIDIEGIGAAQAEKLQKAGVRSTAALLKRGGSAKGRKESAAATNIDEVRLLKWVNHADLFRVRGIGSEYSDLLEAAGEQSTAVVQRFRTKPVRLSGRHLSTAAGIA